MSADHWMKFNVGDYLADTMHLSTVQHGIYILLIMHAFKRGNLPEDVKALARIVKLPLSQWKRHAGPIMALFRLEKDGWHHRRIDLERARAYDARKLNGVSDSARPDPDSQNQDSPLTPRSRGAKGGNGRSHSSFRNGFTASAAHDMQETIDHAEADDARRDRATVVPIPRRAVSG